jgi:hypothetical protein
MSMRWKFHAGEIVETDCRESELADYAAWSDV